MTGDNAPPPGGVAPLRVIVPGNLCTVIREWHYLVTVSSSRCAALHTSPLPPRGLRRSPVPGMLEANNDIPTLPT